jgi:hypothetical protein
MDLDSKYELGAVAANDSESKTFRAREWATGREVFVHILFGGKPPGGGESLLSALSSRMTDPDAAKSAQVFEISDYKGMPFAVTPVLPGFQGLRAWLGTGRGPQAGPVTPAAEDHSKVRAFKVPTAPLAPRVPDTPEDEFDRLFGTSPAPPANPQPAAALPAAPAPPPPAASRQEGEFTRLFRSTLGDIPVAPPSAAEPSPAPRAQAAAPPRAPSPVAGAPAYPPPVPSPVAGAPAYPPPASPARGAGARPPPPPEAPGPGEFTRMFQAETLGDSSAMQAMPPAPMSPPPEAGSTAGEFTRMFQSSPQAGGSAAAPAPQPPAAPAEPGGFTGIFGGPPSGSPSGPLSGPPAQPSSAYGMPGAAPLPKARPLGGQAAGEFTQLFGKPDVAGPGVPSVPPPPPRAQGATGVFSTPGAGSGPPMSGRSSSPGEYTRVFGAQSSYAATGVAPPQSPGPQAPSAAPVPGTPPAAAAKPQMPLWPVVVGAVIVVLAAFGLLLYFLGRK